MENLSLHDENEYYFLVVSNTVENSKPNSENRNEEDPDLSEIVVDDETEVTDLNAGGDNSIKNTMENLYEAEIEDNYNEIGINDEQQSVMTAPSITQSCLDLSRLIRTPFKRPKPSTNKSSKNAKKNKKTKLRKSKKNLSNKSLEKYEKKKSDKAKVTVKPRKRVLISLSDSSEVSIESNNYIRKKEYFYSFKMKQQNEKQQPSAFKCQSCKSSVKSEVTKLIEPQTVSILSHENPEIEDKPNDFYEILGKFQRKIHECNQEKTAWQTRSSLQLCKSSRDLAMSRQFVSDNSLNRTRMNLFKELKDKIKNRNPEHIEQNIAEKLFKVPKLQNLNKKPIIDLKPSKMKC